MRARQREKKVKLKQSIVGRVSFANGLVFLIAFLSMMAVLLISESIFLLKKNQEMMAVTVSNTVKLTDNTLKDMGRISLICFSDDEVQHIMQTYKEAGYREQADDIGYLDQLYTSMVEIRGDIEGISLTDNEYLFYHKDLLSSRILQQDDRSFINKLEMIEKGKTKVGGCSIYIGNFAGYFNYRQTSRLDPFEKNYLYLIRPVRSFKPFQKIGHIVLTTKISHIRDIIDQNVHNLQGEDARYIFSSGEDVVVCSDDGSFIGDTVSSLTENMKTIKTMGRNGSLVKYNGQLGWMVSETSEYSECTFTLIIPMTVIMASLKKPISFAILISLLFAVVTVFISRYITKQRLRRLQVLAENLSGFNEKNLSERYRVTVDDEIGQVETAINHMLDYIDQLVEKEYKNKIKLQHNRIFEQNLAMRYLKSQINPHFLYNTLDTIRIMAALNGDNKAAEMLMELVTFYRKGTETVNQFVPLKEEVIMLRAYLNLMHYRYEGLRYGFDIPDDLFEVQTPNFVLQPLVENSLLHGFKNRGYHGNLKISCCSKGDQIEIDIQDDGVGMDDATLHDLNAVTYDDSETTLEGSAGRHIGIQNVKARLHIYYGESGRLFFERNSTGGSTVHVYFLKKNILTQK